MDEYEKQILRNQVVALRFKRESLVKLESKTPEEIFLMDSIEERVEETEKLLGENLSRFETQEE